MDSVKAVEQAIERMRKAVSDLNSMMSLTADKAIEEARALDTGLLGLLTELVAANDEVGQHLRQFESENGIPYNSRSEECRSDWSRICERKRRVDEQLLSYARSVVKVGLNAA